MSITVVKPSDSNLTSGPLSVGEAIDRIGYGRFQHRYRNGAVAGHVAGHSLTRVAQTA